MALVPTTTPASQAYSNILFINWSRVKSHCKSNLQEREEWEMPNFLFKIYLLCLYKQTPSGWYTSHYVLE